MTSTREGVAVCETILAFPRLLARQFPHHDTTAVREMLDDILARTTRQLDGIVQRRVIGLAHELDEFLDDLPTDIRFAVEVRHRSWIVPETFKLLRHHRVAWTISDLKEFPIVPAVTADFVYIRWMGSRDEVKETQLETLDRTADLLQWRDLIRQLRTQVSVIYGFFNDHYSGHAPRTAMTFKEMLGLPVVRRERWQQASLLEEIG